MNLAAQIRDLADITWRSADEAAAAGKRDKAMHLRQAASAYHVQALKVEAENSLVYRSI